MRKNIYILAMAALVAAVLISGCSFTSLNDEAAERLAGKAESIQPLLPAFSAAQALYEPEDTTTAGISLRTLGPGTTTGTGADNWNSGRPSDVYSDTDFYDATTEIATVGSESSLMEDLNGNTGDNYYFELSLYGENPVADVGDGNLYKVTLYTYPTTSPSVHYVLEEYLVSDDASWPIVNSSGVFDGLAFIRYETYYYDGGVDYRTPVAAYYGTGTHYALADLFDSEADDDPKTATESYTFPADPATVVQTSTGQSNEYSVLMSGTLPAIDMKFYEYYSEGDGYNDRRSVSYLYTDFSQSYIDGTEETVRRYQYDVTNGVKKVRSKTVTTMNLSGAETVKTTYETVDIDMGEGTYISTVEQVKDSATTTTVTDLEEEGTTAGTYTGTVTVTSQTAETVYNATLSSSAGLVLTDESGDTVFDDGYMPVALEEGQRLITMDLPDGGTLEGILTRGILNGIIRSGRAADVIVGPTYVQVIYETRGGGRGRVTR